jgi:PAS domain-containing protein
MTDDFDALARIGPAIMDGYVVVDARRHVTATNPMYGQMLELKPAERKKLTSSECCELLKLECCKEQCLAQSCIKRGALMHLHEIRAVAHDQREMTLEVSALPLKNARGEVQSALIIHRDVTDERRLKQRFMEDQAERQRERSELLKVIESREREIQGLWKR